jgi:hypothetical protein
MNKDKETITKKTTLDKAKESFSVALMSAGILLVVLLLVWIPFKVIPAIFGNGSNFVSTTLSSLFISGDEEPTKTTNTNKTTTKNTNKNTDNSNTVTNTQVQRNYYGKSDLQVSVLGTGIIDPISKQFISTSYAGSADEIAIKFVVKNAGTNISGAWKLRIVTPSRTTPYYDSDYQKSIKPGDMIVFTTSYNNPQTNGVNNVFITADPLNMIDEISESNNQIVVPTNVNGTSYNYNYNYNYGYNTPTYNYNNGTSYSWSNINVTCYANPQLAYTGSTITWYAQATGGNGYYTYSWSGSEMLNGNQSSVNKTYYSSGLQNGYVTVTSNGQSVTKQCTSVNIVTNPNPIYN